VLNGSLTQAKNDAAYVNTPGRPATNVDAQQEAAADTARLSCFPLEMQRRGVSQHHYEADMAVFQALSVQSRPDDCKNDLVCCATLGISKMVGSCCSGERSDLRKFVRKAKSQCDDMNAYYNQYGIRWYVEHTPGLGATILYEFGSWETE